MVELRPEKVREARELARRAATMQDPVALTDVAGELRKTGRPDLSLCTLERAEQLGGEKQSSRFERCLTLAALGRAQEAVQALKVFMAGEAEPLAILQLVANLDRASCGAAIDRSNVRKLLSETVLLEDPTSVLKRVPLKVIGHLPLARFRFADVRWPARAQWRFWIKLVTLKIRFHIFDFVAVCLLGLLSLRYWQRDIHVASLGNFTRLADIVDRLDPALRRLRDKSAGREPPLLVAIYFDGYPNETLMQLYSRHCRLVRVAGRMPRAIVRAAYSVIEEVGRDLRLTTDYRDIKDDFVNGPPILFFPDHEARAAESKLVQLGIDPEKPLICFGLRDMAYYRFYGVVAGSGPSTGARDDTAHRCPPVHPYAKFAHFWADQGYQVVRMGLRVTDSLPGSDHPLIFDYAGNGRSDELDVYLFSHCKFLLAGDTGLFSGAAAFDRPTVISDLFLIRNTVYSSNKTTPSIFVPKLAFDQKEKRYLSFAEWIYFNQLFSFSQDCERDRFELIHNTAEDLIEATCELSERLDGRHRVSSEDIELQKRFHSLYAPYQVGYGSTGLVSAAFLRKHSDLLN